MKSYPSPSFYESYVMFFKYAFNYSARSRRAEFCKPLFINFCIFLLLTFGLLSTADTMQNVFADLILLLLCITFIPTFALFIRRGHDLGSSGWKTVLGIFLVNLWPPVVLYDIYPYLTVAIVLIIHFLCLAIFSLVLAIRDSRKEENEWGESAKYYDDSDE